MHRSPITHTLDNCALSGRACKILIGVLVVIVVVVVFIVVKYFAVAAITDIPNCANADITDCTILDILLFRPRTLGVAQDTSPVVEQGFRYGMSGSGEAP
eukprot:30918-Chlamydomonas_euryale.AAC.1